jgi:hypothetical protein
VKFGGHHHIIAIITSFLERPAHDFLRLTCRVDVGGVDEVDPAVECPVDDPDTVVAVGVARNAEHHGAKAVSADLDTGPSQRSQLHEDVCPSRVSRMMSA